VRILDPETGEHGIVNMSDRSFRHKWMEEMARKEAAIKNLTSGAGVDLVDLRTDRDVIEPLSRMFISRRKRVNA
jgi:hypothetical protein